MKKTPIRTEAHVTSGVFDQKLNGIPYVLREGRHFIDLPQEISEWSSGSRLKNPCKAKRQAVFRS